MAKAKQLPSGSWRVQVYDKELKKTVSFTSKLPGKAGKNEAELLGREYLAGKKRKEAEGRARKDYRRSNRRVYQPERKYPVTDNYLRISKIQKDKPCRPV